MKFKIGQKVRIIEHCNGYDPPYAGREGIIIAIYNYSTPYYANVKFQSGATCPMYLRELKYVKKHEQLMFGFMHE